MFKKPDETLPSEENGHFLTDSKENKTDLTQAERQPLVVANISQPTPTIFQHIANYAQITRQLFRSCRQSELASICKLINPDNYWFVAGALYFPQLQPTDLARLWEYREAPVARPLLRFGEQHSSDWPVKLNYDFDDQLFVLENRSLIARKKQLSELGDIRSLPLESLTEFWEEELAAQEAATTLRMDQLSEVIKDYEEEREQLSMLLLPSHYRPELSGFEYLELEDQEVALSKQRHYQQLNNTNICYVCLGVPGASAASKLLYCDTCGVSVHSKCYPLEHSPDIFRCYTCSIDTPEDQMLCVMCLCKGGLLLPTTIRTEDPLVQRRFLPPPHYCTHMNNSALQDTPVPTVIRLRRHYDLGADFAVFDLLVHGVCMNWHPQLYFDRELQRVNGFSGIREKRYQAACFICGTYDGCCVQCVSHGCQKTFHAECARRSGVSMSIVKKADRWLRELHCQKHRQRRQYEVMEENRWKKVDVLHRTFESIEKVCGISNPPSRERRSKKPSPTGSFPSDRLSEKSRYCVCKKQYRGQSMIECEHCNEWYHFECVQVSDVNHFVCEACQSLLQ